MLIDLSLGYGFLTLFICFKPLLCHKGFVFLLNLALISLVFSLIFSPLILPFLDILDWGWLSSRLYRDRAVRVLLLVPVDAESTAEVDWHSARLTGFHSFSHFN